MNISREQLDMLCAIALKAGREIMDIYDVEDLVAYKEDSSPLTKADTRADEVIRQGLNSAFPGVFVLSEESGSIDDLSTDVFFLVDPLDGTKEFLSRNGEFTVNIALISDGSPVAGVVVAPALGECFFGAADFGSWKENKAGEITRLQVSPQSSLAPLRIVGSRSHGGAALSDWISRVPGKPSFMAIGSSIKFCRIAEGLVDIYPRFGPTSQWDTAAGQCILQLAGGNVVDGSMTTLTYGRSRSILNPDFFAVSSMDLLFDTVQRQVGAANFEAARD